MHEEHRGFLWGILAAITGSGMALFVKLSVEAPLTTLVFIRFALAIPIVFFLLMRKKVTLTWKKLPLHLTRSLAGLAALFSYYYAVQHLDLVNAVTLRNAAPLFMPLIALIWLKVVVSKRRVFALCIGFLGVIILLQPGKDILIPANFFALLSAILGAIAMMSIRQLSRFEPTEVILSYYFTICTVITLLPMIIWYRHIQAPIQWVYLFGAGFCALVFQYAITKAYTYAPATKVSTVSYLSVFFGGLFGWLFFEEVPTIWVWLGALLIIIGAILALTDKTKARRLN